MKESLSRVAEITEAEPASRKIYTVSEVNREIRGLLESRYPSLWVEGEISNLKLHSSGHIYLTLKDDKAQLSAVFFSRFNQSLKFQIKDGLKVVAMGRVSLYEARGQYQFYIERIEPKGLGALQLAFLQLKEKLEKEGLFDLRRKKPIPKFPHVVGIVTSPTGAAIRDILNVVHRRFHGTAILIHPVKVQGEGAAEEVARAVHDFNERGGIDVMIVGRGGGSLEDLWAFNEETVARAVYASRIPIISAVGHEIDWTICDLVADLRAPTPSAAAELVVQNREEVENRLRDFQGRMRYTVKTMIRAKREDLTGLQESYAFKQPLILVQQFSQRLDEYLRQLQNYLKSHVLAKRQAFQKVMGCLNALSPLAILERGYSITLKKDGSVLKEIAAVKAGETIQTRLAKGILHSEVINIQKSEGPEGDSHDRRT